jgi:hypothetical protein
VSVSINPSTKVGELLDAYPGMEEVLIGIAPEFSKLRNPLLRRTVAKIATLEQAAKIGGVEVRDLVNRLREAAGQPEIVLTESGAGQPNEPQPDWYDASRIVLRIDAAAMLAQGVHPLGMVQKAARELEPGGIIRIESGFRPEPLIDVMKTNGLFVWSHETSPGRHVTDICRP